MTKVMETLKTIDPLKCMGNWYVQVAVPTAFDRTAHNGLEEYTWDPKAERVRVKYTFNDKSFNGKVTTVHQVGRIHPSSSKGTHWQVAPWLGICHLPFWLDYIVVDVDDKDYSYLVASSPTTGGMSPWLYIMTRAQEVSNETLAPMRAAAEGAGWDLSQSVRVPQRAKQPAAAAASTESAGPGGGGGGGATEK